MREETCTKYKYGMFFLQQKKLFIWNMHYQYKLGDCKTYTVLVSLENTKFSWNQKGQKPVLSQKQKSLNFQNQNRAELCRFILWIIRREGEGETRTHNQRKALPNETAQGKKQSNKIEKEENIECFIYFNKRKKVYKK